MSLYQDRIARGDCGMCGKPNPEGGSLCAACKAKAAEKAAARRAKRAKDNKCIGCGVEIIAGSRCTECKAKQATSRKKAVAKAKDAGLCVSCLKAAVKEGCTMCQSCIDNRSEVSSEHYRRRKEAGLCRFCDEPPEETGGSMCAYHKAKYADYRLRIRLEAMEAYGGPVCVGCQTTDLDVLVIDHVEGGGNKHRKELNMEGGSYQFYLWLRDNGYPAGYRVLCHNCNHKSSRRPGSV